MQLSLFDQTQYGIIIKIENCKHQKGAKIITTEKGWKIYQYKNRIKIIN